MSVTALLCGRHAELLRAINERVGAHYSGLGHAARVHRGELGVRLRRRLLHLDIATHVARHADEVVLNALHEEVMAALDAPRLSRGATRDMWQVNDPWAAAALHAEGHSKSLDMDGGTIDEGTSRDSSSGGGSSEEDIIREFLGGGKSYQSGGGTLPAVVREVAEVSLSAEVGDQADGARQREVPADVRGEAEGSPLAAREVPAVLHGRVAALCGVFEKRVGRAAFDVGVGLGIDGIGMASGGADDVGIAGMSSAGIDGMGSVGADVFAQNRCAWHSRHMRRLSALRCGIGDAERDMAGTTKCPAVCWDTAATGAPRLRSRIGCPLLAQVRDHRFGRRARVGHRAAASVACRLRGTLLAGC